MNKLKFFLITTAAIFIFIGSVGFDVFTHLCDKDGFSISYFVQDDTHCDDHEGIDESDCCTEEIADDCCHDELRHINLKLDYVNKIIITPIIANLTTIQPSYDQFVILNNTLAQLDRIKPPPKSGKTVLLEKQSWLI